jgi:hypothetical protein
VNFIDVLHPHRHPYALVPFFVSIILERSRILAPAAASLCSLTQKTSHAPEPAATNLGGVPQSQSFFHPHFSNQAKLAAISETFNIGVRACAFMMRKNITGRLNQGPFMATIAMLPQRCIISETGETP